MNNPIRFDRRICAFFCLILIVAVGFSFSQDRLLERFDAARLAWDTGDFIRALDGFEAVLKGPDGGRFVEKIALITGELYQVKEIAGDGRTLRISPDGKYGAYEAGPRGALLTRIFAMDDPSRTVLEVRGANFVFSPVPNSAAFLRVQETAEIALLRKDIDKASAQPSPDRQNLTNKQRQLSWLEAKYAEIVILDIAAKKEKILKTGGLLKTGLVFSADGREIYFVGAGETDTVSNEIYAVSPSSVPRPLTSGAGFKTNPSAVPGGKYLVYTIPSATPFPKPAANEPAAKPAAKPAPAAAGDPSQRPAGPGRAGGGPRQFAVMSLADGKAATMPGSAPVVSADGSVLVFLNQEGSDTTINLISFKGALAPVVLKKTSERIGSAAPAPDGSGVVFDMTYTRNGEIFTMKSDGKGEVRLSREIENDRAPRFLTANQVLAIKGEPRFSRSYIYDLKTLSNVRVFHNETIRTIAPEYEWVADPAGSRLLISSERDGDTIGGRRGVYLVELAKKISPDDLLKRIQDERGAEKALRAKGEKIFQPLREAVQAAVDQVSITKIYDHEETLFNLDSKYYTLPANALAADYICAQLKSFGYAPEYQTFETRGTKTSNVLAKLTGTENPDLQVVLGGHFDSVQRGPGADDNSSVTAINLETARILAGKPLPCTVVFAFFTGEEAGELGSREFIRVARENQWKIAAVLNNDMIGWADDFRLDDTIRFASYGLRDIQHAAAFLFSRLITYDTHYVKSTDGAPFYDAYGSIVSGLGSYPVLGNPYYHQPTDLLETVNHQLLVEAAKFNIASVMMVASSPQPVQGLKISALKKDAAEITWTAGPEKAINAYLLEIVWEHAPAPVYMTVQEPRATLSGFSMKKGEKLSVAVKAVTARGIESWDWARAEAVLGK